MLHDFAFYMKPYVLPLSLQEYWDSFYADDAQFFYDKTLAAKGEEVKSFTRWMEPEVEHYKTWQERPAV